MASVSIEFVFQTLGEQAVEIASLRKENEQLKAALVEMSAKLEAQKEEPPQK
jgi:hypothetical protein